MDRPATVTTALLGVLLIGITLPYFLFGGGGEGANEYTIGWSEAVAGTSQGASGATSGSSTEVSVPVADSRPSTAVIRFSPCADGATPPVSQPATITWTLFEGAEEKDQGTASCNNAGPFEVDLEPEPDVATAEGSSRDEAERAAYEAAGANETLTFRLVFSWTRGGGLPIGPATPFATTGQLEIREWRATANPADQEAPR